MRGEQKETYKKLLTDELPIGCNLTGTGRSTNQLYGGPQTEHHESYDHSFQCQQFDGRISLYIICSGNKFSDLAKEKLVAEILFGNFNESTPDDVKGVLRRACASLEKEYVNWLDEYRTRHVDRLNENQDKDKNDDEDIDKDELTGIHIAIALIYNSKLYTWNTGHCRIILCKTDNNNVLRAVQMSTDYDCFTNTTNETLWFKNSEIVGPIPLIESHRFLVLMSSGLCKTLEEVLNHEQQNMNRELIQAIVQQFRIQPSLVAVAQTVIERIVSQYYANNEQNKEDVHIKGRTDLTLMIRNFNFSMPNETCLHQRQEVPTTYKEYIATNSTIAPAEQNSNTDSNYTISSTTTSSSNRSEFFDRNRINPYVDFSDYFKNVEAARSNGTLPTTIQFN